MHLFPTNDVWGCSFIFMGIVAFLFDTKLMLIHILGYTASLILAHILHWNQLVSTEFGEYISVMTYRATIYLITSASFLVITFLVERFLMQEQEHETENVYLLEKQLEYYQSCDLLDRELRKFRHDIKGHFVGMEYLLECKNYEELSEYFNELKSSFSFQEKMYFSGNLIIDSILNYDIPNKLNSKIERLVYGRLIDIKTVSSIDLCTLFSNMLSNAIGAANQCINQEKPILSIHFDYGSQYFSITIVNSILENGMDLKSSKSSHLPDRNHGYGMRKMMDICEKYNGMFNQTSQQGKVTTSAYLPL